MNKIKLLRDYDYCYQRGYEDCIKDIINAIKIVRKDKKKNQNDTYSK